MTTSNSLDAPFRFLLHNVSFRPVFIIGEHRSGTTILYKLLAATERFNFVKYYHITNYDEVLFNHIHGLEAEAYAKLTKHFEQIGLQNRGFDNINVTPDLPEEYGFILKRGGSVVSPPWLAKQNRASLVDLCRKIQFVADDPTRPVLLKNPWDASNFMFLKQAFPEARFIFIHRHPIPVINSKLKAMRSIFESKNHYSALLDPSYGELFDSPLRLSLAKSAFPSFLGLDVRILLTYTWWGVRYFMKNMDGVPAGDTISIRYEDLCQEPEQAINSILAFINTEPNHNLDYKALIQPRPLKLTPTVAQHKQKIQARLKPYLDFNGYVPI